MFGNSGNDEIDGGSGRDRLIGQTGQDKMLGDSGNDELIGGKSWDELVGGKDSDRCRSGELVIDCESGFKKFGNGIWRVSTEVAPGFYRNSNSANGCYWARLSGFGGELDDILANEFTFDRDIVEIRGGEKGFESDDCGTWTNDLSMRKSPSANMGAGAFLVRTEIKPGLWRNSNSSDGCYWERTTGFTNTLGEIIANSFSHSIQTVQISLGDVGFTSNGCGTWRRIG